MRALCRLLPLRPVVQRGRGLSTDRYNAFVNESKSVCEGAFWCFEICAKSKDGNEQGALKGWPVAIKDNICTDDGPTTCASKMLKDYQSPYEATVVTLLKRNGAKIIGKTNLDEFGMGIFGPTINPASKNNEKHSAGGSSGGSAAAVASGQCRVALGTDTGGSVRLPAAYCGVVGFKPSYGLLSRWGVVAYASSLDTVGILGNEVHDVAQVFDSMNHYDSKDPTAIPSEYREKADSQSSGILQHSDLSGVTVGIPIESFPAEMTAQSTDAIKQAVAKLRQLGAKIVSISLPTLPHSLGAYYVLSSAEAASNLARYSGMHYGFRLKQDVEEQSQYGLFGRTRSAAFGDEVKKRMLIGNFALNADAYENYFLKAQSIRQSLRNDFDAVFKMANVLGSDTNLEKAKTQVNLILTPSAISPAPLLEDKTNSNSLQEYVQDLQNVPASLAGLPAISLPVRQGKDLPMGVQLIGQWGSDKFVLNAANLYKSE